MTPANDAGSDESGASLGTRLSDFVGRAQAELASCEVDTLDAVRDRLADEAQRGGLPEGDVHVALKRIITARGVSGSDPCGPGLSVVKASNVEREEVEWVWTGRVPRRKTTIIEGDPGLGKSTLTLDVAARVTRGWPMPGCDVESAPADVVLLCSEDGIADTIKPRLAAHGADLDRVHIVTGVPAGDGLNRPFTIPHDVPLLRELVLRVNAALIIIDPLIAHLAGGVNSYKDHDVRIALAPLSALAEESGAAIVFVRHLVKSRAGQAIHQGGGSIGFIASVRSALVVVKDPDDPVGRIVASQKSNLAPPSRSLRFTLESASPTDPARIHWRGESDHSASELLADPERGDDSSALDEAVEFLRAELSGGARWSKEIQRLYRDAGHTDATVRRARPKAGVSTDKVGDRWMWSLRDQDAQGVFGLVESDDEHLEPLGGDLGVSPVVAAQTGQDAHSQDMSILADSADECGGPPSVAGVSIDHFSDKSHTAR
jgi:hypothetical protein